MDEAADVTTRTQRFSQAARTFTPPPPTCHVKLVPFKDGIVEPRQEGASLRLTRELLATADVAVGPDTVPCFLVEINGDPIPRRPAKPTGGGRPAAPRPVHHQPAVRLSVTSSDTQPSAPDDPPAGATQSDAPTDRSGVRGPRATSDHAPRSWPNKSISSSTAKRSARASLPRTSSSISRIEASLTINSNSQRRDRPDPYRGGDHGFAGYRLPRILDRRVHRLL